MPPRLTYIPALVAIDDVITDLLESSREAADVELHWFVVDVAILGVTSLQLLAELLHILATDETQNKFTSPYLKIHFCTFDKFKGRVMD